MRIMRPASGRVNAATAATAAIVLAAATMPARAQTTDIPAVAAAKVAIVGDIVSSLPHVPLDAWLHNLVDAKPVRFGGQLIEPNRPTITVSDLALVPSFMSEAARVRQAQAWTAELRPGMTRAEVERLLDHPVKDGGIRATGHARYYLGFDVKLDVPLAPAARQRDAPTDRVSGPAVVSRGAYAMD
jgi:hypothetical protein